MRILVFIKIAMKSWDFLKQLRHRRFWLLYKQLFSASWGDDEMFERMKMIRECFSIHYTACCKTVFHEPFILTAEG